MMISLASWLTRHSRRKTRTGGRRRRGTPGLELLEGRVVLSTFTVNSLLDANPPAGQTTLRQAIMAVNSDKNADAQNPDIIKLTVSGTIALESALPAVTGSVEIEGPGAAELTIKGDSLKDTILTIAAGASVTVSGVTIDGNQHGDGGATVASGASLSMQSDIVQNCESSTSGGGILNNGGSVTISESSFISDYANSYGGGIANLGGELSISQSTFSVNLANVAEGGAVYSAADSGGNGGVLTVLGSTFTGNLALGGYGGAIDLDLGSNATVVDSTFTGNLANIAGGAIALQSRFSVGPSIVLSLSGSTVTDNTVGSSTGGGGIFVQPSSVTTPVLLYDSIIAGNTQGGAAPIGSPDDVTGAVDPRSSYNLIGDGSTMTGLTISSNGNLIGSVANPIDPELGPLQNNGGPTLTIAPLPDSPAIDRGGPDPVGDRYTSTDQAGDPRIVKQPYSVLPLGGDGRDIGAIEIGAQSPTILVVNSLADANAPEGTLTLRQAIEAVDGTLALASLPASQVQIGSPHVDQIEFSVTGTISLSSALPAVSATANVVLEGPARRT